MSDFMDLNQYLDDLAKQLKKREKEEGIEDHPSNSEKDIADGIFGMMEQIVEEAAKSLPPENPVDAFIVPSPTCGGELNDANWINWFLVRKNGMTKDSFSNDGEAFRKQYGTWTDHLKYEQAWASYLTNLGYVVEGPHMLGWSGAE